MVRRLYVHNLVFRVMVCNRLLIVVLLFTMSNKHAGARAFVYATFGLGAGLIVERVSCCGNEANLSECILHDEDDGYCSHHEDAGVQYREYNSSFVTYIKLRTINDT